ncbi:MAG TPA: hypothetical protein DEF18_14750 [Muricauda sp.]|nr:hypothetical protein [Allomuricauda sp.]HBU79355.1 hypothetical protein [Allomuricauda sp.]
MVLGPMLCFSQSVWKSPTYQKRKYRKVMVVAKTSDGLAQRQLEDATVQQLKENGISAIPAYAHIKKTDYALEETLRKKVDELEVDALLAYTFDHPKSAYKSSPSVDARVGVPVKMGIFRGFLGTSVPLAGETKNVDKISGKATWYTCTSDEMQWSQSLSGKLNKDTQKLAEDFAQKTIKSMVKHNLF